MSIVLGLNRSLEEFDNDISLYQSMTYVGKDTIEFLHTQIKTGYLESYKDDWYRAVAKYKEQLEKEKEAELDEDSEEYVIEEAPSEDAVSPMDFLSAVNKLNVPEKPKDYIVHGVILDRKKVVTTEHEVAVAETKVVHKNYVLHGVILDRGVSNIRPDEKDEDETVWPQEPEEELDWSDDEEELDWSNDEDDESLEEVDWSSDDVDSKQSEYDAREEYFRLREEELNRREEELRKASNQRVVDEPDNVKQVVREETLIVEKPEVGVSTETVTQVEDIPKEVRDYVRKHKDCSKADVLKYYSKKQLETALRHSKIVERHGKLFSI